MALPKKKSRLISVEDTKFRYIISTGKPDEHWNFRLSLIVQDASGKGNILKIEGLVTRDFWLDFPNSRNKENYPVLKPKDVAEAIKYGIKSGWQPKENNKPFILKLDNSFITDYQY